MPDPLPVGVVEPVSQPLGLQQVVSLRVEEQRLPSPANNQSVRTELAQFLIIKSLLQLPVLLPESVQVDGAPDAGPLAADDDDGGGVDGEEGCGAGPAVDAVSDCLVHGLPTRGATAGLPQADHHPAQQADGRVLRDVLTHRALSLVVELKQNMEVSRVV